MNLDNIILITSLEVSALLLVVCVFLVVRNRRLNDLLNRLRERMQELVSDLKLARVAPPPPPEVEAEVDTKSYADHIEDQLVFTRDHHGNLDPTQDISLDLSPENPMPRRVAAMRNAILLAEKEALAFADDDRPNWDLIRSKYEQLFSFFADYSQPEGIEIEPETPAGDPEELESLKQELENAKKRVSNLEKFKKLYFELEAQWDSSQKTAKEHYNNLTVMADQVEDKQAFETALNGYNDSYKKFNNLFNDDTVIQSITAIDPEAAKEIAHLRSVAADQHRTINELEAKLANANSDEEKNQIVEGLKGELDRMTRFVKESETCIQLMEEELNSAHKEVDILKSRMKAVPSLKTQLKEVTNQKDEMELKVYALSSENRKLAKQLKEQPSASSAGDHNARAELEKMKKELQTWETNYAELEERYLDLKMGQ